MSRLFRNLFAKDRRGDGGRGLKNRAIQQADSFVFLPGEVDRFLMGKDDPSSLCHGGEKENSCPPSSPQLSPLHRGRANTASVATDDIASLRPSAAKLSRRLSGTLVAIKQRVSEPQIEDGSLTYDRLGERKQTPAYACLEKPLSRAGPAAVSSNRRASKKRDPDVFEVRYEVEGEGRGGREGCKVVVLPAISERSPRSPPFYDQSKYVRSGGRRGREGGREGGRKERGRGIESLKGCVCTHYISTALVMST